MEEKFKYRVSSTFNWKEFIQKLCLDPFCFVSGYYVDASYEQMIFPKGWTQGMRKDSLIEIAHIISDKIPKLRLSFSDEHAKSGGCGQPSVGITITKDSTFTELEIWFRPENNGNLRKSLDFLKPIAPILKGRLKKIPLVKKIFSRKTKKPIYYNFLFKKLNT